MNRMKRTPRKPVTDHMNSPHTVVFLMANLGSEVSQLFSYAERQKWDLARSANARAERIIGELLAREDLGGGKAEVEILRTVIEDLLSEHRRFSVAKSEIDDYFMPFSLRVLQS